MMTVTANSDGNLLEAEYPDISPNIIVIYTPLDKIEDTRLIKKNTSTAAGFPNTNEWIYATVQC